MRYCTCLLVSRGHIITEIDIFASSADNLNIIALDHLKMNIAFVGNNDLKRASGWMMSCQLNSAPHWFDVAHVHDHSPLPNSASQILSNLCRLVICLCSRRLSPILEFSGFSRDEGVQKLPARLISSELSAHQMSPSGVPPHWRSRRALQLMDGSSL